MTDEATTSEPTKFAVVRECALLHRPVKAVARSYGVSAASEYRWVSNALLVDQAFDETPLSSLRIELMAVEALLRRIGWNEDLLQMPRKPGSHSGEDEKRVTVERLRIARSMVRARSGWLSSASSIPTEIKYALIRDDMVGVPISSACDAFGVAKSGYYAWLRRTSETRYSKGERMRVLIARAAATLGDKASYRRISEHLRSAGVVCSRHRVKTLMVKT